MPKSNLENVTEYLMIKRKSLFFFSPLFGGHFRLILRKIPKVNILNRRIHIGHALT